VKLKEYKYLSMAIDYEMNPIKLSNEFGNGLMARRINSLKDDNENSFGPLNSKGKKFKIIDMSNPESAN